MINESPKNWMWGLKDGFLKFLKTAQKDFILLRVEYQKMMDDTR
ncbi:hypothetical protein AB434_2395 [Heyndrickxia coagulans]|uniref:Uncharacterized protein n=1 Tax=Heyndrickxia coagulans TaxID=1398 RepID=A0AAN0WD14_HEYCO|nr:hypothetical protein SB48_HM08orf04638 [Heyndrickxia coagulans]AKN54800.1 hypothetical protein AB434_2395 [Heyndrickxia coagulans]